MIVTDYIEENLKFKFINNGDRAYKDNDNWVLMDVPKHYEGSRMYRTNERF